MSEPSSNFLQAIARPSPLDARDRQLSMAAPQPWSSGARSGSAQEPMFPSCAEVDGVSVIITCYNQSRFLGDAIESVLSQSHPAREIIVVDDGSTDTTASVASRYNVKYVRQRNRGLSAARNRGIAESSGAFLLFLDADDRLLPCALAASLVSLHDHPNCAFVYGGYQHIGADSSVIRHETFPSDGGDAYGALLHYNRIGMHAAVMYRRCVFDLVGGFNARIRAAEDYELFLRIARRYPIHCHAQVIAEYRKHDSNMSNDAALMLRSMMRVLRHERRYVRTREEYRRAWELGVEGSRAFYLERLRQQVRRARRGDEPWARRLRSAATLLRCDPRGLAKAFLPLVYYRLFQQRDAVRNRMIRALRPATGTGTLAAAPNPIRVRNGQWDGPGVTTISWRTDGVDSIEIRVGSPDGPLFSSGIPRGSADTGEWVVDGTRFYLQDTSAPREGGVGRSLSVLTVNVVPE